MNENISDYIVRETSYPLATKQEVIGELVRCKDCHYTDEPIYEKDEHDYWCREHSLYVYEDDYCSYGERKSDDKEAD